MRVLFAWIGATDLKASKGLESGPGPIAGAVDARPFDRVELLSNYSGKGEWKPVDAKAFGRWLGKRTKAAVHVHDTPLSSPMHFGEVYEAASRKVSELLAEAPEAELTFHVSPGTSAMAAVWVLLAKGRFRAELIQSSIQKGVETCQVPFEISTDFAPQLLQKPDEDLVRLTQGLPPEAPEFDAIVHRCGAMKRLIARARRLAPRNVSVLILGESGTGKELLARAIHRTSLRREGKFLAVNCGAIPENLVDSELFGHARGAFTGASGDRKGYFEAAQGGTLFLDEVGELPPATQVRLLRVLQEGKLVRVGETAERPVDVRILAATHRDLFKDVVDRRFREDLFHRLAVGVLKVPALRDRTGDLDLLIDRLLKEVLEEASGQPDFEAKTLSPGGRALLHQHTWPGNVRELRNTLLRALAWSSGGSITRRDMEEAILPFPQPQSEGILGRPLGPGLAVREVVSEVARHYLSRALERSGGNKTEAARLVGLPSATTFSNWASRYGVELGTPLEN